MALSMSDNTRLMKFETNLKFWNGLIQDQKSQQFVNEIEDEMELPIGSCRIT